MDALYFGYADCLINPPRDIGLAGYQARDEHGFNNSGIADDLYAKALVLKNGSAVIVIATLDLCLISESTGDAFRNAIAQKLSIPVENVLVNLSHTHSGPQTYTKSSSGKEAVVGYVRFLTESLVTIASQAHSALFKCRLYTAEHSARLGYNRRYIYEENSVKKVKMLFNQWRNPEHDYTGVLDMDIPILMLERSDEGSYDPFLSSAGTDRIVIFNVPVHPVIMGGDNRFVSAEYPGAARKVIESSLGSGTKSMFLLGTAANINALFACQNNLDAVKILGNALGYGVLAALSSRKTVPFDKLDVICEQIILPENKPATRVIVQNFKIGKAALCAFSCECFVELGVNVRKRSPFMQTLVASNSNGGRGYIPTADSFSVEGGYEVPIANKTGFHRGLLEEMEEMAVASMYKMKGNGG